MQRALRVKERQKCPDRVCSCIPSEVISFPRHQPDQTEARCHCSLHQEALHSLSDTYIIINIIINTIIVIVIIFISGHSIVAHEFSIASTMSAVAQPVHSTIKV